jgi:anaerobic dimethyl sulfoxide reductase subunit A
MHTIYQKPRQPEAPGERLVTTTCAHNCGGRCVVNAHVRDGRIVKISTQPGQWNPELPPLFACVRGFATEDRVNHPDRLKYPMRRVGDRGAGEFERISWDEALNEVARQMLRIRDTYGPAAILDCGASGSTSILHNRNVVKRLLNMFGGCTERWGSMSNEAEVFAFRHTYGKHEGIGGPAGREPRDYINSKLIVLWGWTPGDGSFGTGTLEYLKWAKKNGVRMVCVDPRVTHTSATLADQHIFIKPSTDAAMLIAMAYVIVAEELHDQAFLDRYVLGFDEAHLPPDAEPGSSYRSYLLGLSDGTPKTPAWAEAITGVPAAKIASLAQEFATCRPAALHCGYAPGRTAFGEQFHRAAYALSAVTGSIGTPGGNTGCSRGTREVNLKRFPGGTNPIDSRVNSAQFADLLVKGQAGGYPADIKMVYSAFGHLLNQLPNPGKAAEALKDPNNVECIVVHEHFMTPMARYADILLPATTFFERNDVQTPWGGSGHYAIFMDKAIAPMYECRNDLDICADLAKRLGIAGYPDRVSDMEWLREFCEAGEIDDFDAFRDNGVARLPAPADEVAFAAQIRDLEAHPFMTPSKKIELYSTTLARQPDIYGLGAIPAIPTYIPAYEPDPRHPLQLISAQSKARTHSTHANQALLAKLDPQMVWIHPKDAAARGIVDGQLVRIRNDVGTVERPAKVTDHIAPGVVSMNAGAWYTPDETGTDHGGCGNTLATDRPSPAGSLTHNTCLVEVEPAVVPENP